MDSIELGVLEACQEVTLRQRELLPLLADALDVPESDVWYTWALRSCGQCGALGGTDWVYFFHGYECDLSNVADGRHMRIDFGPRGRLDTFTSWGVLQFIMTSVPPWHEDPHLKEYFGKGMPPYDRYSGCTDKFYPVWDRLEASGAFEKADQSLVDFQARHTALGPDGIMYIRFPPGTSEETAVDCSVAHRQRLSPWAIQILESQLTVANESLRIR